MTTTHISNERLEWLRDTLNDWISFYEDPADSKNHAMFTDAEAAIDELLAARQTIAAMSSSPVAWTDDVELRDVAKNGCGYIFKNDPGNQFADPRRQIMLFAAPQPAVVPDGGENE